MQLADAQSTPPHPREDGNSIAAAPVSRGRAAAEGLVHAALGTVLQTALEGLADESTSQDAAMAHVDTIQGVVRALDAVDSTANGTVAEVQESPAGAPSADAGLEQQAIGRYRQDVWDALQGFAEAPANAAAAAAARVHVLDLLSAIARASGPAGPSRWGDWRPPAAAAGSGPDAQHSLLYSCTRALLEPLWPDLTGSVSPADLADVSAAKGLFARLLDAAESPQQLAALAELLEDTWRNGAELAPVAASIEQTEHGSKAKESGDDAAQDAAASATSQRQESDASGAFGQQGCWVPAAAEGEDEAEEADLGLLHDCWSALLVAMLRRGQTAAVVQLIDAHGDQPHWLSAAEAHSLAAAAFSTAGALASALALSISC